MFAGYACNQQRPLRYEEWIPAGERPGIPLFGSQKKMCELTCIWIEGKQGRISSELIYLHSVIDALASGASFILGGTLSPEVLGIQTQSRPVMLYSGYTDFSGSENRAGYTGRDGGRSWPRCLRLFR